MTATVDHLTEQAMQLSLNERAELAERLIRSLEPPGDEVPEAEANHAWAEVIRRRSDEIHEGRVAPIDWEEARQRLRDRLAARPTS